MKLNAGIIHRSQILGWSALLFSVKPELMYIVILIGVEVRHLRSSPGNSHPQWASIGWARIRTQDPESVTLTHTGI